jgi:hypothetical protein
MFFFRSLKFNDLMHRPLGRALLVVYPPLAPPGGGGCALRIAGPLAYVPTLAGGQAGLAASSQFAFWPAFASPASSPSQKNCFYERAERIFLKGIIFCSVSSAPA